MPARAHTREYRLISADSHLTEPGDLWTSRVAARFRDRVPHIERFAEGDAWVMDGLPAPVPFGYTACAGNAAEDRREWLFLEEMRGGGWDPAARVAEQDVDGIDAEVLFPNRPHQAVVGTEEPELHHAMVRAYNDWLSEYCSHAPDRLWGVGLLSNRGVPEAVAELERIASLPGLAAVQLSAYPHGNTIISEDDDPLWAAASDADLPVCIHIRLDGSMPARAPAGTKLPGIVHFSDAPTRMIEIIFAGVLDRFPRLRFVLAEVDCGWMPYFEQQADDNYTRHRRGRLKDCGLTRLPSEYMREFFSATYVTDDYAVANRDRVGLDRMMWSSDFPHITSDWPHSWQTIEESFEGVSADDRHAILAGNAQRIFGFAS